MQEYCPHCGRKLTNPALCPRCGRVKEEEQWEDTKHCKMCDKKIDRAANYCQWCGADQAILVLTEDKAPNKKAGQAPEPVDDFFWNQTRSKTKPDHSEDDIEDLIDFIKRAQEGQGALPPAARQKNESKHPGLYVSTKLMLKDTFRYNKRAGRADFWFGFLGVFLVTIALAIILGLGLSFVSNFNRPLAFQLVSPLAVVLVVFFYVVTLSGAVRRLHDIGLPGAIAALGLLPVAGQVILFLALAFPHNPAITHYKFGNEATGGGQDKKGPTPDSHPDDHRENKR